MCVIRFRDSLASPVSPCWLPGNSGPRTFPQRSLGGHLSPKGGCGLQQHKDTQSLWIVSENGSWGQDEMMVTFLTRFCHRCLPLGSPGPSLAPAGDSNKAANEGRRGRGHRGEVHAALAACPTASSLQTLPGSLRSRSKPPGPNAPVPHRALPDSSVPRATADVPMLYYISFPQYFVEFSLYF